MPLEKTNVLRTTGSRRKPSRLFLPRDTICILEGGNDVQKQNLYQNIGAHRSDQLIGEARCFLWRFTEKIRWSTIGTRKHDLQRRIDQTIVAFKWPENLIERVYVSLPWSSYRSCTLPRSKREMEISPFGLHDCANLKVTPSQRRIGPITPTMHIGYNADPCVVTHLPRFFHHLDRVNPISQLIST